MLRLAASSSHIEFNPPRLPDLELIERIGFGAYGEVWLACNRATGARRAVKIVSRAVFSDDRPFRREFEGIKKFDVVSRSHPSQLALFHVGKNDAEGFFYYVMELADSTSPNGAYRAHTLRFDLEKGRMPAAQVLDLAVALGEALAHLHANGLIHRDIKPSNIIFIKGTPKLADIGLVTDASDECSIVGTEGYLPPEGPGAVQADIFALGKVLYEATTGCDRREFPKLPENLRSWDDARLVFELNEIILRACASDAKQRYATAEALLADLKAMQKGKSIRRQRSHEKIQVGFIRAVVALGAMVLLVGAASLLRKNVHASTSALGLDSTNMEANAWCDRGMLIIRSDVYPEFPVAYTNLHHAIDLDPNFARPYACLLELLLREQLPDLKTQPNELRNIRDELVKLAPELASTYCARSIFSFYWFDSVAAERFAVESTHRDPEYELGHTWYAFMLLNWGRTTESRREIGEAQRITPSKSIVYRGLGHCAYFDRDFTNAIRFYQQTLDMQPYHTVALNFMGDAYRALGNYEDAVRTYEKKDRILHEDTPEKRMRRLAQHEAVRKSGGAGYWLEEWKFAQTHPESDFYWQAVIQMHLGNTNAALDWLEKSYATGERYGIESPMISLLFDEHWDGMRDHPRIAKLLDEIGFTPVINPKLRKISAH